jgi:hypothetical protein
VSSNTNVNNVIQQERVNNAIQHETQAQMQAGLRSNSQVNNLKANQAKAANERAVRNAVNH